MHVPPFLWLSFTLQYTQTVKSENFFECVVSVETFPRTHAWWICTCFTMKMCFFLVSLDLVIAAHNAVFVFLNLVMVNEVKRFI
jgi:hypothetical protein